MEKFEIDSTLPRFLRESIEAFQIGKEKYEREKVEKKLLMKLQEAQEAVKDESAWMSLNELKVSVGV